jgi:DNA helicase IV
LAAHPDLQAEQAYIDQAYERLEAMKRAAGDRLDAALAEGKGTPQALAERDIVVRSSLHRLEQLDIGREPLCFGRIDRAEEGNGNGKGHATPSDASDRATEAFYIGRLAVSGAEQEPLVVDWRAPVAEPFYRATGRHPMGLTRRRHFATDGPKLLGIEDELFSSNGAGGNGANGSEVEVAGPGALLAALERSRSGRMRDIVATVQREQDEIIRAPLRGILVVQGGPGTGKTAVALHRAAYLLYTHRFPLETQGVLVVGPNPVFLRYIDQVLPSLGETGVALTTVDGLVDTPARGTDSPEASVVKGSARMVKVLAKAVRDRERALPADAVIPFGPYSLTLSVAASESIVAQVRRRGGPHNPRRRQLEALVAGQLKAQYGRALDRARRTQVRAGVEDLGSVDEAEFARQLRGVPSFVEALDRMWPVLTPHELLHDLFGARVLLRLAGRGVLDAPEVDALHRRRSTSFDDIAWTSADLPLLDEARVLLGPRRRGSTEHEARTYGHIVVDEAQDLSPMQLRVLARRSLSGSMTVVGDLAQATGNRPYRSWDEVLEHLPAKPESRVVELTVNYRTPGEVMDLATRLLPVAAPGLRPPRSVRRTGEEPRIVAAADDVTTAVVDAVRTEAALPGTVAVLTPPSLADALRAALGAAGVPYGEPDRSGLDADVTLMPVGTAKGLEFDSVIVVEPARIVDEAPQGLRALFVALTRPTRSLTVVHAQPLPEALVTTSSVL